DMSQHEEFSGKEQQYMDHDTHRKIMPTVIETSVGLDRTFLALLCKAYDEEVIGEAKDGKAADVRTVLRFPATIAPIQVAILPLSKKLSENAKDLYNKLNRYFRCEFDVTGSIGKRYRRQDEIGTPYCITFDFESVDDNAVTVRHRDSMEQERVAVTELRDYLETQIG
ncbi:MAG: glycine--tRNA ligase, partial [Victivallales bacterium]|nr:glycine--tRNA ligase [Victivallales bacterium]